jgi:hypothetical protein
MALRSSRFWAFYFLKGVWSILVWIWFTLSDLLRVPRIFYSKRFHALVAFLVVAHILQRGYVYFIYDVDDIGIPEEENFVYIWATPARTVYGFVVKVFHLVKLFGLDYMKISAALWLVFNLPFFIVVIAAIICPCLTVPIVAALIPLWNRIVELLGSWSEPTNAPGSQVATRQRKRQKKKVKVVEIETPDQSDNENENQDEDRSSSSPLVNTPRK